MYQTLETGKTSFSLCSNGPSLLSNSWPRSDLPPTPRPTQIPKHQFYIPNFGIQYSLESFSNLHMRDHVNLLHVTTCEFIPIVLLDSKICFVDDEKRDRSVGGRWSGGCKTHSHWDGRTDGSFVSKYICIPLFTDQNLGKDFHKLLSSCVKRLAPQYNN